MNFFEHQDRARRKTAFLILLFILAVAAIVIGVNLVIAVAFGLAEGGLSGLTGHRETMAVVTLGVLALIGGASAYRMIRLSAGGAVVAQSLGAIPVPPDTADLRLRRLVNVVEETALASGVPVPRIFILEQEDGINAFAAGFGPADAVVAVTRGTLDRLNREELQGVVAHEFSHIINGDMRLNIRLMGVLFGILVIGVIGRTLLWGRSGSSRGSRNLSKGAFLGLALMLLGYIGVFFGQLIKASVSRQREYLADAAAVQFTRNPSGIAGALKKIGALSYGSRLKAPESEEVSHMLFSDGSRSFVNLWATHPPLENRIRAIEPGFQAEEIEILRKQFLQPGQAPDPVFSGPAPDRSGPGEKAGRPVLPGLTEMAGSVLPRAVMAEAVFFDPEKPDPAHLALAASLCRELPGELYEAAHDPDSVEPLILALVLGDDAQKQENGLSGPAESVSAATLEQTRHLAAHLSNLDPRLRLPLVELAMPALRLKSPESISILSRRVMDLVHLDGRVSVFEYALGRLLARHVTDILKPSRTRSGGRIPLKDCGREVTGLLAVAAMHGHTDPAAAAKAFRSGMSILYPAGQVPDYQAPEKWIPVLDRALDRLDGLSLPVKQELIRALLTTLSHDGVVTVMEAELLRAVCGILHVPVPPVHGSGN
jgi:Zn-dependent protease with chaperone function